VEISEYEDQLWGMTYAELAGEFRDLTARKKDLKDRLAQIEKQYDALTIRVLPDKMAEDGFKNVTLEGVGRFQASTQAYCSTRAGQKEALFQWLQDNGFEDLITEVVNPSTLKSFVKECRDAGRPAPPDEIVNYEPYTRVTLVKS
jgi:hypothetical protein